MTDPEVMLATSDCSICSHPQAAEIDAGLLSGTPIRTVAGSYGLSRSAVGRHRLNHLSAEAVAGSKSTPGSTERPEGLRMVDVHAQLTALADRLEHVVEVAIRNRKATATTAAIRELRQTLEAIARLQADPELQRAAAGEAIQRAADEAAGEFLAHMIDFLVREFVGIDPRGYGLESQQIVAVIMGCLRVSEDKRARSANPFAEVDATPARQYRERQAVERAKRMDQEVQRRVEAELQRREAQQRPAIEVRVRPAIEGGGPVWTA